MLFSFNDDFIAELCGGLSDEDTTGLFSDGIEAMMAETEEALERTTGHSVKLRLEDGQLVAPMTPEEAEQEFGAPGVMMKPAFRQAFIQASNSARLAFDKVVNSG
jgi:hypothetical protein